MQISIFKAESRTVLVSYTYCNKLSQTWCLTNRNYSLVVLWEVKNESYRAKIKVLAEIHQSEASLKNLLPTSSLTWWIWVDLMDMMVSLTRGTWVWASSGSWCWTGKPAVMLPVHGITRTDPSPWGCKESDTTKRLNWLIELRDPLLPEALQDNQFVCFFQSQGLHSLARPLCSSSKPVIYIFSLWLCFFPLSFFFSVSNAFCLLCTKTFKLHLGSTVIFPSQNP